MLLLFFASQLSLGCDSFLGIEHKKTGSQILFKKVGLIRFSQLMVCGGTGMWAMAVKYYARFRHSAPYNTTDYNYLFVSYFFYWVQWCRTIKNGRFSWKKSPTRIWGDFASLVGQPVKCHKGRKFESHSCLNMSPTSHSLQCSSVTSKATQFSITGFLGGTISKQKSKLYESIEHKFITVR